MVLEIIYDYSEPDDPCEDEHYIEGTVVYNGEEDPSIVIEQLNKVYCDEEAEMQETMNFARFLIFKRPDLFSEQDVKRIILRP